MNWETLDQFKDWWLTTRAIRPPFNDFLFRTDIATCFVLFREGQYQIELVLGDPGTIVKPHTHPHIDFYFMYLTGEFYPYQDDGKTINKKEDMQKEDPRTGAHMLLGFPIYADHLKKHGGVITEKGAAFINIEKWKDTKPTSVAVDYSGESLGPKHDALIQAYKI